MTLIRFARCATPLLLAVVTGALAASDPSDTFDRYVAAANAGDMVGIRALIAPDVARSDFVGCRPEMDNPACLAHYIETTVVGPHGRITVLRREIQGDTVQARLELRTTLTAKIGVERIVGRDVVRVTGGRIADLRFIPDFSDEPTAVFFGSMGIGPRAKR